MPDPGVRTLNDPAPDDLIDTAPPRSTSGAGGVRGAATVVSDLFSVSGARVVAALLSVVTVVINTRLLTPQGYGVVAYVATLANLLFTVTSSWTATAVARYGREELDQRARMTHTSWNRLLLTAPLLALALIVIAGLRLAGALPPELTWPILALAVASGVTLIVSEHVTVLLEAAGRMKLTAIGLTLRQAVVVIILLAVRLSGGGRTPAFIIAVSTGGLAMAVIVFLRAVWSVALWPPQIDRPLMRRMLVFSIPFIAFAASQYVVRSVDIVLIRTYRGAADTGIYAVAYQGYSVLQQVATTATIVLTPLFVSLGGAEKVHVIRRYLARAVPQVMLGVSVLAGLGLSALQLLVPVLLSHRFRAASHPLAILFIALILYTYASLLAPIILLHERSRAVGLINVVAAGVNVVGDAVLLGAVGTGVIGPAIATTVALVLIAGGYLVVARQSLGLEAALPVPVFAPALPGLICALVLPSGLALVVGVTLTSGLTVALLRWHSPFASEDADMLDKLRLPGPVRRLLHRAIAFAER